MRYAASANLKASSRLAQQRRDHASNVDEMGREVTFQVKETAK